MNPSQALAIIPAYSHIDYRLMNALLEAHIPIMPLFGSSDLPRARSILISHALTKGAQRLLFIDSDIIPTAAQLVELATSPLVTPKQALTGLYPIRDTRSTIAGGASWAVDAVDQEAAAAGAPVFAANWAGLGFAAIHHDSLSRVAETLPQINGDETPWRPYCVPAVVGSTYYSDDRVLWRRLAQTGTQLVASNGLKVGHVSSVVMDGVR